MHIFKCYMDDLLSGGLWGFTPFTDTYYIEYDKISEGIPEWKSSSLAIEESNLIPPHYNLTYKKEIIYILPGRPNAFMSMVVMLYLIENESEFMGRLGNCDLSDIMKVLSEDESQF